jgi:hypothetical protein
MKLLFAKVDEVVGMIKEEVVAVMVEDEERRRKRTRRKVACYLRWSV